MFLLTVELASGGLNEEKISLFKIKYFSKKKEEISFRFVLLLHLAPTMSDTL
jgi:hypothetical protein